MDNILVDARNSILNEWKNKTFFLYETKYYYLDNMRDVLTYLVKNVDKENIVVFKYLEATLSRECYEYVFFTDINKFKSWVLSIDSTGVNQTDEEIRVEFADMLFKNIMSYLKNSILPCPYPKEYCEGIMNLFFNLVKEELSSRPQEHGTSFMRREILNSWIELGIWYNDDARSFIHVDADIDYIEAKLKNDIRDIISDTYYGCNAMLQRGLFAYICDKYRCDEEEIRLEYDIDFLGNNSLTGIPESYEVEKDEERILDFIVATIRNMIVEESVKSYCLDDIDTFCCSESAIDEDEDDSCLEEIEENTYVKESINTIIKNYIDNSDGRYDDYFKEFLKFLNGNFSDSSNMTFSFALVEEWDSGSHSSISFYLDEYEFTISKGGYELGECGGDSYTEWTWNEPLTEYLESYEIEERLNDIKEYFSDVGIKINIEEL